MPTVQCPNCGRPAQVTAMDPQCSCGYQFYFPPTKISTNRPSREEEIEPVLPRARKQSFFSSENKLPLMLTLGAIGFIGLALLIGFLGTLLVSNRSKPTASVAPPPPVVVQPPPPPVAPPVPPVAVKPPPPPKPRPFAHLAQLTPHKTKEAEAEVTDADVRKSMERAVEYLLKSITPETLRPDRPYVSGDFTGGINALTLYALLTAGRTISDPRLTPQSPQLEPLFYYLNKFDMNTDVAVYARAMRIAAFTVYNRPEERNAINDDLKYLLEAERGGAYWYKTVPKEETMFWDNSNSQYGLLGVWAAAQAGYPVPLTYWKEVEKHWETSQHQSGGWSYHPGGRPTLTMTAAGVTSLFVTRDQQVAATNTAAPLSPHLLSGLKWMANEQNIMQAGMHRGYALFGIERAALASGIKYFGEIDWFRVLSKEVLTSQHADGSWEGNDGHVVETAFRLLFLCRGREPIFISKLQFGEHWNLRPRDVANLTAYAGPEMERHLNWQIINIERNWRDWLESPVLFMASEHAPNLSQTDLDHLRHYIESGGLLFTHADRNSAAFTEFVGTLARQLFPNLKLEMLPQDHVIYSMVYPVENKPPLMGVSNGNRLFIVHSPTDFASQWKSRRTGGKVESMQMGVNIAIYGTGRRELRYRLETSFLSEPSTPASNTIPVARLQYAGNWNPEPAAWDRMARYFRRETDIGVTIQDVPLAQLREETAPLAHLTGTQAWTPNEAEINALRDFVRAGGVVLIEPSGKPNEFYDCIKNVLLPAAFPNIKPAPLENMHELFTPTHAGMLDVTKPRVRGEAAVQLGRPPQVQMLRDGKGYVLLSEIDLATGFLGTQTTGIIGYTPEHSLELGKNILLWMAKTMDD